MRRLHHKLRHSCIQLAHINNLIAETELRYHRALRDEGQSQKYSLRIKLYSLKASQNMCYEYSKTQEEKLKKMQVELYNRTGIAWTDALTEETDAAAVEIVDLATHDA